MDDFEFKMPSLKFRLPTKQSLSTLNQSFSSHKKGWRILGFTGLGFVGIFLIYQLFRLIMNYPVLAALDNKKDFTPQQISKDQTLASVNEIIELPNDQNGTIGTIKDVKSLESKASFFKKARNGDILVIYPNMTIIYDPENHNVVDIAKTNLLQ